MNVLILWTGDDVIFRDHCLDVSPSMQGFLNSKLRPNESLHVSTKKNSTYEQHFVLLNTIPAEGRQRACHYIVPTRPWAPSITICASALRLMFKRIPKNLYISL